MSRSKVLAKLPVKSSLSRRDLLKGVAGLGVAAAFSGCEHVDEQASSSHQTGKPALTGKGAASKLLAERADDYLRQIFEVARGPGGLIISHSRFDTRRPLQENDPDLPASLHQVLDSIWGKD